MIKESADGAAQAPVQPRQMRVERQGQKAEPYVRHHYQVRGGICEHCGVMDPNVPSQFQYKLCPHYRGMDLKCSYCDEMKNPDEVIGRSILNIVEHPDKEGTLIVTCDSYDCQKAHQTRFQRSV